jgi:DNA-binding response OmpR family regulator
MLKILIVDDASFTRLALRRPLERENFIVIEASTAEEGLQALAEHKPDLVITDYLLPYDDGMTFLKKAESVHKAPFFLMTHRPEAFEKALKAGFAKAWLKPVEFLVLLEAIRAQLPHCGDASAQVQQLSLALDPTVFFAASEAAKKENVPVEQFIAAVLKEKFVVPAQRATLVRTPAAAPAKPDKNAAKGPVVTAAR